MIRLETSIHLSCPAPEVFAFLVDPQKLLMWQSDLVSTQLLTAGPLQPGSRFREVRVLGRRATEIEAEISALELDRRLATRTLTEPQVTVNYLLDSEPSGTRLCYEFTLRATGIMRLFEPLIRASIRKGTDSDFRKLKQVLEA